jgi:amino-acid N-acetyltransferase
MHTTPPLQNISIAPLEPHERAAVHELLSANTLPLAGFDAPNVIAIVARDGERVVGSAAIEQYGAFGLLRSVAVAASHRNRQLGSGLTRNAIDLARRRGLHALYLLTETAGDFFPKFGFRAVSRADIPLDVQQSVEFTSACPASAQAFVLQLTGD